MKAGRDVLLSSDAEKAAFVPEIDVAHQMYNNIWEPKHPGWMSDSYLENKRNNARILRDKGIAKYRMYEVRGVSHAGGESEGWRGQILNLDLAKAMDRFLDMLDAWADKGIAPPPTHSDWAELGDANRDGTIEYPALAFPEIACPLGVYFPFPDSAAGTTSFAAFTGDGLEPLDGRKVFVDMNRNGVWDYRETPTQAWRRLGLLQKHEELTRDTYVACVQRAAEQGRLLLRQDRRVVRRAGEGSRPPAQAQPVESGFSRTARTVGCHAAIASTSTTTETLRSECTLPDDNASRAAASRRPGQHERRKHKRPNAIRLCFRRSSDRANGRRSRPALDALAALWLGASVVVFFVRLRELRDFVVSV